MLGQRELTEQDERNELSDVATVSGWPAGLAEWTERVTEQRDLEESPEQEEQHRQAWLATSD